MNELAGEKRAPMDDLDPEALFPTHGAIDEERQIGRTETIIALADRLRVGSDALLLEPRRVGKTSVVRAALVRIRLQGSGVTAEINLTAANVRDGPSLAYALLDAMRTEAGLVSRLKGVPRTAARQARRLQGIRKVLERQSEAEPEEVKVFGGVLDLLELGTPSLDAALEELAQVGQNANVVLFLDEFQETARWADTDQVQETLARFLRRDGRRVAVVVAGSDRSATEALFAEGSPLHWTFDPFVLPPIDRVDWHKGIKERFEEAGYPIAATQIDQILDATAGHPLRTMSVAKEALRETLQSGDQEVAWVAVDAAITTVSRHPSWTT